MVFFYEVYIYRVYRTDSIFCKLFYSTIIKGIVSFCRKIQIGITYFNPFKYFQFSIDFN